MQWRELATACFFYAVLAGPTRHCMFFHAIFFSSGSQFVLIWVYIGCFGFSHFGALIDLNSGNQNQLCGACVIVIFGFLLRVS